MEPTSYTDTLDYGPTIQMLSTITITVSDRLGSTGLLHISSSYHPRGRIE